MFASGSLSAHELTPTYPKLEQSYMENILRTKVKIWNARIDVKYYKIEVTDKDWNPVPFITKEKVLKLEHLQREDIEIFFPKDTTATYICTRSLLQKDNTQRTVISSKVCSKIQ